MSRFTILKCINKETRSHDVILSLTVTLVCARVHLCQCPADVERRHFYLQGDGPSGSSLTLLNERMTSTQKEKSTQTFTLVNSFFKREPPLKKSLYRSQFLSLAMLLAIPLAYFYLSEHPGVQSGRICGGKILFFCWVCVCVHMVSISTWGKWHSMRWHYGFLSMIKNKPKKKTTHF